MASCDLQFGQSACLQLAELSYMSTIKPVYRDTVYAQVPHCCLLSMYAEWPIGRAMLTVKGQLQA